MKKLLFVLVIFADLALATPKATDVSVKDFNFTYKNPEGTGTAVSFGRSQLMDQKISVHVQKVATDFILNVSGAENLEFVLENAPAFMTEADTMKVNGFNLDFSRQLKMSLLSASFTSYADSLNLRGVTLDCARNAGLPEVMDEIISGCFKSMSFKSTEFTSQNSAEVLMSAFTDVAPQGAVGITGLDLKVNSGNYALAANIKGDVSGKVKSSGTMSYNENTGVVTLKITEVKFSILNVTGKVFEELKKMENEDIKVNRPYVYLKVK